MKFILGLICILFSIEAFSESTYYKVVAQDGSGDYLTIQEAVNSVLVYQEQRSIIKIMPGIYREKLVIPAAWCNISLIGDDPTNTIISYDDNANKNNMGTYNPQIQISAESETKRSIFREKDKTKRSKKESAQHSKSRNKSFVMTSVSAL